MSAYRDDPEYIRQSRRLQWIELEVAKITYALDKIHLEYVRDSIYVSATVRAELTERRSDYRMEAKQLFILISGIKEDFRAGHNQDKYDTLVVLLNDNCLGHLVVKANHLRKSKELA